VFISIFIRFNFVNIAVQDNVSRQTLTGCRTTVAHHHSDDWPCMVDSQQTLVSKCSQWACHRLAYSSNKLLTANSGR